jgi:hypothetical protein
MIYCVVPPELADELYDKLVSHYANNPNVQVIVDRRKADRRAGQRRSELDPEIANRRQERDRRRARPGTFPALYDPDAARIASGDTD